MSSVDSSTATFVVTATGTDPGGSGMSFLDFYVQVDGGAVQQIARVTAGTADSGGHYTRTINYQAISDGNTHDYRFYSIGEDFNGNVESAPTDPNADIVVTASFATPANLGVTAFDVQHGATERSFIRYLDLTFNLSTSQTSALDQIVASVNDSDPTNDRIKLIRYGLDGSGGTQVSLAELLHAVDHVIEMDFGVSGLGGNANSTAGDGYYAIDLDLDGNGSFETVQHFYRLLGDVNGDHVVDNTDIGIITLAFGQSGSGLEADANGDGVVNALDRTLAIRSRGRRLSDGLSLDDQK